MRCPHRLLLAALLACAGAAAGETPDLRGDWASLEPFANKQIKTVLRLEAPLQQIPGAVAKAYPADRFIVFGSGPSCYICAPRHRFRSQIEGAEQGKTWKIGGKLQKKSFGRDKAGRLLFVGCLEVSDLAITSDAEAPADLPPQEKPREKKDEPALEKPEEKPEPDAPKQESPVRRLRKTVLSELLPMPSQRGKSVEFVLVYRSHQEASPDERSNLPSLKGSPALLLSVENNEFRDPAMVWVVLPHSRAALVERLREVEPGDSILLRCRILQMDASQQNYLEVIDLSFPAGDKP